MNSPFSSFLENDLEVCKSNEGVGRVVVVVVMDLFQDISRKRDIWTSNSQCVCPGCSDPLVSVTTRGAWSLGVDRSPRFSETCE